MEGYRRYLAFGIGLVIGGASLLGIDLGPEDWSETVTEVLAVGGGLLALWSRLQPDGSV